MVKFKKIMQEIEKTLEKQKEIVNDDINHHYHNLENLSDTHHSIHGSKYKRHDNDKKTQLTMFPLIYYL